MSLRMRRCEIRPNPQSPPPYWGGGFRRRGEWIILQ